MVEVADQDRQGGTAVGPGEPKTPCVKGEVPMTATRHCLVPVLSESAKTSFLEARTTPLRSVVLSRLGGAEN